MNKPSAQITELTMMTMPLSTVLLPSRSTDLPWECHKCHHTNKDRKRCCHCKAWKDGITPYIAARSKKKNGKNKAAAITVCNESSLPNDENASPNIVSSSASSCHLPTKRKESNVSGSADKNNIALRPSPISTLVSTLPPTSSTQPSALPLPSLPSSVSPFQPSSAQSTLIVSQCPGVYNGYFGKTLVMAGMTMLNTGRRLIEMARQSDFGQTAFRESGLSESRGFLLPFYGMIMDRAPNPMNGYVFRAENCSGDCIEGGLCGICRSRGRNLAKNIKKLSITPCNERAGKRASIHNIAIILIWQRLRFKHSVTKSSK